MASVRLSDWVWTRILCAPTTPARLSTAGESRESPLMNDALPGSGFSVMIESQITSPARLVEVS
ncbi:NAD dependent epimerase/dehydratase family enzyme [Pseudomonas syringae pv. actinidiae]|uniref:NAD dependent epimerase/dehydratase family enzyme n=2 Tax=Pseudomonas syringae group TaxID=136849 RepID=A0AAN4Q9S3_PSESF|nr:NAD dependent epimerase/dehydratase family enzyme [Pseudomonas syringae pv. actinidiae]